MKSFTLSGLLALASAIMLPVSSHAEDGDVVFTYDYEGATLSAFGVQKNVPYDVAMLLKDPSLVGFDIIGVSVDIAKFQDCTVDPIGAAWLTKELKVVNEYNLPDLQQVNGEIKNYGTEDSPELRLDLTFPEPYTLTEEGVYVGYSVTVTNCKYTGGYTSKFPIVTVTDIDKPQSFMIHTQKSSPSSVIPATYPEWTDLSTTRHEALAMRVILRGKTLADAAILEPQQTLYVAAGTSGKSYVALNNQGTTPINSIDYSYSYEVNGQTQTFSKSLTLETPVTGQIGAYTTLDLDFEAPEVTGNYDVTLWVDKVNGVQNGSTETAVLNMEVLPFLPVNNPLIEDYTGLWCGYCPIVYVTLKQMVDKYGHDVLAMSYHTQDAMQGVPTDDFPSSSYGAPKVYIGDRSTPVDNNNIEYIWLRERRKLAPVDINVNLFWVDASHKALRAEAALKFLNDESNADYMITYALVEDDMSDPSWRQDNQYTNSDYTGPYWDLFVKKPMKVSNLVFDDVVVNFPNTTGIQNSLPVNIVGQQEYKHYSNPIYLKDAVCVFNTEAGKSLIKNANKLRIVALVIDGKTGNVVNSASTPYSEYATVMDFPTGVDMAEGEAAAVVSTDYFTFDGVRLAAAPANGACIVVDHLSDGTVRTTKRIQ